jgi:hypothetical protein
MTMLRRGMGSRYFVVVFVIGSKLRDLGLYIQVVVLISEVVGVVMTGEAIAVKHYFRPPIGLTTP